MNRYTQQIEQSFTYHQLNDEQTAATNQIRSLAKDLAELVVVLCPESRETSLALTKLDETVMHANSAIARHNK